MEVGNKDIRLVMMDTPAQSAVLTNIKLNKQAFVFLLYDVSSRESFDNLLDFIEAFNLKNDNPCRLLYIIGNKTDLGVR